MTDKAKPTPQQDIAALKAQCAAYEQLLKNERTLREELARDALRELLSRHHCRIAVRGGTVTIESE